ncbi:MAG TPA: hypothetical protein VFU14_16120 [Acidimicrobiales bacterium]|nr:hypothetical protein [Acidimicrobiales bacterium]
MLRGRARRWADAWLIGATAVLLLGTGGPSLLLSELDLHVVLGAGLAVVASGHLWLQRSRSLTWVPRRRGGRAAATLRRTLLDAQDAGRELAFAVTVVTGAALLAGAAGETLHLVAGFGLMALAAVHAGLHRAWFVRRLRRRPAVSPRAGVRP